MLAEQTKTALGSGSGRSRNSWAQNFACKSAQGKMATASHVNSAHDNSISEATEAISACRNQFRARSIKTKGTNFGSIKMYMVEVFVHANPADGQPTQFARDFKLWWGLTSPRQFRTSERSADRNYARGWQRMERNTLHIYKWCQILASLRSSIITHVEASAP